MSFSALRFVCLNKSQLESGEVLEWWGHNGITWGSISTGNLMAQSEQEWLPFSKEPQVLGVWHILFLIRIPENVLTKEEAEMQTSYFPKWKLVASVPFQVTHPLCFFLIVPWILAVLPHHFLCNLGSRLMVSCSSACPIENQCCLGEPQSDLEIYWSIVPVVYSETIFSFSLLKQR